MSGFIVVVELTIRPDAIDSFMSLMQANASASLQEEPGCRRFDICVDPVEPGCILLYEIYDDPAAFAAHMLSPHYRSFDAETAAMIGSKSVRKLVLAG